MASRKRRQVEVDPRALVLAIPLAQGFADLGLVGYNQFANRFVGAQNKVSVLSPNDTALAVAAVTNMALAAELFVKIFLYQATGAYATGHDLAELEDQLPIDCRALLERSFERAMARKPNLLRLDLQLFEGEPPEPQTAASINHVADAIKYSADLFVKLRYLHEDVRAGFAASIDFQSIIFLVEALKASVADYNGGNLTVKWRGAGDLGP